MSDNWLADMISETTKVVTEVVVSPLVGIAKGIDSSARESANRKR